jgi:diguanylate cyclase (GGDEF)-like protein
MAVAMGATVTLTWVMLALVFGTDHKREVALQNVEIFGIGIGAAISALVAGILTYRSGNAMKELNQARANAVQLSHTDQLTGLLNRRGYNAAALKALSDAGAGKVPTAVFMCDIDRFKAINDQFGHDFGDQVLVEISQALRSFAQANGMLVGRLGGEEFAALMIDVTIEQAIQQANALRRICAAVEISNNDATTRVTVSIGISSADRDKGLSEMMRLADQALYKAKNGGRNRVAIADISASAA